MKVAIFITLYQRPHITEICFNGLDRIRECAPGIDFTVYAIGHEGEDFDVLCKYHDINYLSAPKDMLLGEKIIKVVRHIMKQEPDFDYLMKIDSDDLVTNSLINRWYNLMENAVPFFGSRDKYVLDLEGWRAKYFTGYSDIQMGVSGGKMLCRDIVFELGGEICKPFLKRGIDYSIKLQCQKIGATERLINTHGNIELKSSCNIHGFDDLEGGEMSMNNFPIESLSADEWKLIKAWHETYRGQYE